jgi:murein DD-endopeptidase MepM/ murein hydrolase activator NlpD
MLMGWLKRQLGAKKVSVMVVPDKGGTTFSFKLPLVALHIGIAALGLGVVFFILMTISWATLLHKASTFDRLVKENEGLLAERDRVLALQARIEQLGTLETRIRRALGAEWTADSAVKSFPAERFTSLEEPPGSAPEAVTPEPAFAPAASRYTISQFHDPGILKELDVPSLWPVKGYLSRGLEANPVAPERSHQGVDIAASAGAVVKATAGGVVVWTGWSTLYGNVVVLAHASGYFSMYGHNQINLVRIRERVERGTPIALLGNTGQSSAPHLHFEIWRGHQPLDPTDLLMPM